MKIKWGDGEESGKKMRKARMRRSSGKTMKWEGVEWVSAGKKTLVYWLAGRGFLPAAPPGEQLLAAGNRKKDFIMITVAYGQSSTHMVCKMVGK